MRRNYLNEAQKRATALEKKKMKTQMAEKTHKLTTFFKQTRNTTEDNDVEQSSGPRRILKCRLYSDQHPNLW